MSNLRLIISIIQYLKEESHNESLDADTRESLEVAVQCLQTAYDLESTDPRLKQKEAFSLPALFEIALTSLTPLNAAEPVKNPEKTSEESEDTKDPIKKAGWMKNIGNDFMKKEMFSEAVRYYTAAIDHDGQNAIYYCNRAAAYSKLGDFKNAVTDCEKAVQIDPLYAKAYGRLGLAYVNLNQHEKAVESFKKAVELDTNNESYQTNLTLALEKVKPQTATPSSTPGETVFTPRLPAGLPPIDFATLFANPVFRSMASSLMQDPNIMSALTATMNNTFNPRAAREAAANATPPDPANMEALYEAGQLLASQLQAGNPDVVEQIRQQTPRNDSEGPSGSSTK